MPFPDSPDENHLLAALPAAEFQRLAPHLQRFPMRLGETLYRPGEQFQYAHFPTSGIVSLLCLLQSGASSEIASVGNEGVLGISLFMGGNSTTSSAVVQTAGVGYRLKAKLLREAFMQSEHTQSVLLGYTRALSLQIGQTASCNRYHSIEQQLCRLLLANLDRLPSNELVMTHELVAGILGVRRESITGAAQKLQRAGVLRYRRGHITVFGRTGLEAAACECYAVLKHEFGRLRSGAGRQQTRPGADRSREASMLEGSNLAS